MAKNAKSAGAKLGRMEANCKNAFDFVMLMERKVKTLKKHLNQMSQMILMAQIMNCLQMESYKISQTSIYWRSMLRRRARKKVAIITNG